jgi:hypothetical protein
METERHIQFLQTAYAGALAETVIQYGKEGVLERVTDRKLRENLVSGKMRANQFGITTPEDTFVKISELFGCAKWKITGDSNSFIAETGGCMLCGIAKKIGAPNPCHLYCLDPMEGLVKAVKPEAVYTVEETLWEGSKCRISVVWNRIFGKP